MKGQRSLVRMVEHLPILESRGEKHGDGACVLTHTVSKMARHLKVYVTTSPLPHPMEMLSFKARKADQRSLARIRSNLSDKLDLWIADVDVFVFKNGVKEFRCFHTQNKAPTDESMGLQVCVQRYCTVDKE